MTAIQAVLPIASLLSIHVILAHWRVHWQLKFFGEVLGRAPMMFIWDAMAIFCAVSVVALSAHGISGHTFLGYPSAPSSTFQTDFASLACFFSLFLIMKLNAGDRFFVPTVAGIREGVIRTLVTLRLIDRAENLSRRTTSWRSL